MRAVCADFECELMEFNGEDNHVHLLVNFPPKVTVTKLVNSLKGVSSRRLRQEFPDLVRHYWRANKLWSGSYFAGTVGGAPLSMVKQYIEQQNRPVRAPPRLRRDRPSWRSAPQMENTRYPAPPDQMLRRSGSPPSDSLHRRTEGLC